MRAHTDTHIHTLYIYILLSIPYRHHLMKVRHNQGRGVGRKGWRKVGHSSTLDTYMYVYIRTHTQAHTVELVNY